MMKVSFTPFADLIKEGQRREDLRQDRGRAERLTETLSHEPAMTRREVQRTVE